MPIRIIIADDHSIVRSGIRELLESSGEYGPFVEVGSADALVEALEHGSFDLVLTDFKMPGGQITDGLNLLELVRQRWPLTPLVVLTMVSNIGLLRAVLDTGVRGLLNKADALDELGQAVRAVIQGQTYISTDLRSMINAAQAGAPCGREMGPSRP